MVFSFTCFEISEPAEPISTVCTGMTNKLHAESADLLGISRIGAPRIAGTGVAFTPHRYHQEHVARELTKVGAPEFTRFAQTSGVTTATSRYRSPAIP